MSRAKAHKPTPGQQMPTTERRPRISDQIPVTDAQRRECLARRAMQDRREAASLRDPW